MKIAIISDLYYPHLGGGEFYLVNLDRELLKKGHEVIHLTSKIKGTKDKENFEGAQIIRAWIPFPGDFMKGRFFFPFTNFSKIDALKDVDIIQSMTYPAAVTGWALGKLLGKPNVIFCHEFFRNNWKYMRNNFFTKRLYPVVENFIGHCPYDWAITPSIYSKKSLIDSGFSPRKITVAYHGMDPRFKLDAKSDWRKKYKLEDKKLFGFIGRLRDFGQKGMIYLLEATKMVAKEIPDSRLVLAGSGYEYVVPLVKKLGIEKFVVSLGKIPIGTEPKFYSMLDVFAGASIVEGFGLVYAEASRCGKPVVATNGGSIPEVVQNGKTGVLVPVRNSKALAEGIIKLLNDSSLAKRMGKKGAEFTKKFTWENSVKKHLETYEKLVK
jgi:glycosyltransferase involved in cell wall biosynthesis